MAGSDVPECDNFSQQQPLTTAQIAQQHFILVVNGYLSLLCVLGGTVGNLYGVRSIHSTNFDKNRGVVLAVSVLALAFWDTVLLWCAFFYYVIKQIVPAKSELANELNLITPCFHAFSQIANTASIWLVAAIMIQRFMAARDPFRSSSRSAALVHSFREQQARRASSVTFFACAAVNRRLLRMPLSLSAFAVLINITAFFEIHTSPCTYVTEDGSTRYYYKLAISELRRSETYKAFRILCRMLFTTVGPMLLIIVFSIVTLVLVRGSNRSRRRLFRMSDSLLDRYSSREQTQNYISFMLVGKCFVMRVLPLVMDITEIATDYRSWHGVFMYCVCVSNFLVLLNSATTCIIFLKASTWLNEKLEERKSQKRKKTLPDNGQMQRERVLILSSTWEAAMRLTNGQIGSNVLCAMTRKREGAALLQQLRPSPPPPPSFAQVGDTAIVALIGLPQVVAKKSVECLQQNTRFHEVAEQISGFIAELLEMMRAGTPEDVIKTRIRRVGAVHHAKNVKIPSAVWKEFKASLLHIVAECEYPSEMDRERAVDVWRTFISFIISEMKLGVWAISEITIGTSSSSAAAANASGAAAGGGGGKNGLGGCGGGSLTMQLRPPPSPSSSLTAPQPPLHSALRNTTSTRSNTPNGNCHASGGARHVKIASNGCPIL